MIRINCIIFDELAAGMISPDVTVIQQFLNELERPLTDLFRTQYPKKWKWLSIDGFYPTQVYKKTDTLVEIMGMCIFVDSQQLTPFWLSFTYVPQSNRLLSLESKIGQVEDAGEEMRLWLYQPVLKWQTYMLSKEKECIGWLYEVRFEDVEA